MRQVEAQEKLEAEKLAEKKEKDMMARVAFHEEKAKLRGTQKNNKPASGDPSTWSKEKAERISQMWCE